MWVKPIKGKSVGDSTLKLFDCSGDYPGICVFRLYSARARHPTECMASWKDRAGSMDGADFKCQIFTILCLCKILPLGKVESMRK